MEFGSERYYRTSGAAPIGGILLSLLIGIGAGALLAFVYAFINWYNPIVYVTFLATCGLSIGTGMGVVFGMTLGKVRNRAIGGLIGLVSGLSTFYFAWVFYLWVISDYVPVDYEGLPFNPSVILPSIQWLGENGLWSIRGGTPTGWGLYTFWLIEAGIVVLGPTILGWIYDAPFCETCDTWADEHACGGGLQVPADLNELKRDLEDEQYDRLHELMKGSYDAGNFMQIKVWMCPHCEDSTWMTVEQMVTTTNAKGESNTATTAVVKYLTIPRQLGEEFVSAVPRFGEGAEALLTDTPEGERQQPTSIPLAGDDADDDADFWETKKT